MLGSFQQPQAAFKSTEASMLQQMLCKAAMLSGYQSMPPLAMPQKPPVYAPFETADPFAHKICKPKIIVHPNDLQRSSKLQTSIKIPQGFAPLPKAGNL